MKKSLGNIRVLDLSRVLAGPYCTQILGDLGADIIKIERPGTGDDTRQWGPPFMKDKSGADSNESAYYLSANRNKKSLAIDIKTKDGQALIHKLLESSDVLIENFKTGGLAKYGLGYDQIKEKYPRLVYCSITGFGHTGPLSTEPGYDFVAQAMGGLMACTGGPDDPPMKTGVALGDVMTGLNAAIGILAALHHRESSGRGQMVDLSLLDCTLSSLTNIAQYYLTSGKTAPRIGNAHSTIVPYQDFETADGHIVIGVGNNTQFKRFCEALGKSEWAEDTRFKTNTARLENRDTLIPLIKDILAGKSAAHWIELFAGADIPTGPVNTMDQTFAMEQVQVRGMEIAMNHPDTNQPIKLVGSPLKLSETPPSYDLPPPTRGQHTQEILEKLLNLSADEIAELQKNNIIEIK